MHAPLYPGGAEGSPTDLSVGVKKSLILVKAVGMSLLQKWSKWKQTGKNAPSLGVVREQLCIFRISGKSMHSAIAGPQAAKAC